MFFFRRETSSSFLVARITRGNSSSTGGGGVKTIFPHRVHHGSSACDTKTFSITAAINSGRTYIDIANGDTARHFCGIVWGGERRFVRRGRRGSRLSRCKSRPANSGLLLESLANCGRARRWTDFSTLGFCGPSIFATQFWWFFLAD